MTPDEIKHFLIAYDSVTGMTTVKPFGTDYEAAQAAYAKAEQTNGLGGTLDIVLISSDSLATIERTHSSYFGDGRTGIDELLKKSAS